MRRVDGIVRLSARVSVKYSNAVDLRKEGFPPPNRPGRRAMCLVGLIMGAVLLTQEPSARAQGASSGASAASAPAGKPDLVSAKKHYDEGETKFRAGDYAGAEIDFRIANNIKATPQAERYIGRCLEELGRYPAAIEWYEKFLSHVPERMSVLADRTRKRTIAIRAMPGKVHIDSKPAGASVTVDGQPASGPAPLDLELAPGTHAISVSAAGHVKLDKSVDVGFASSQTVSAELESEAPAAPIVAAADPQPAEVAATEDATPQAPQPEQPAPPPPSTSASRAPAYVTGGIAVVAAGVGAIFGIMALNDAKTFNDDPSTADTRNLADTRNTHALIADLALGSALAFGITSAVLFLTTKDPTPPDPSHGTTFYRGGSKGTASESGFSVGAAPLVGAHAAGATLVFQF
jgi:hypothetical protein